MTLADMNRYQRGQAEFLHAFIRWASESELITDEIKLAFVEDFGIRFNLDTNKIEQLVDYFEQSPRDYCNDDPELLGYLVYRNPTDQEHFDRFLNSQMVQEEVREIVLEREYDNLPPHILNLIENYETLDDIALNLNTLNTQSTLGEISIAFGFSTDTGLLEMIISDFAKSDELSQKIEELNTNMVFSEYVEMVGGSNPEVALDAMRIDILKTVSALTS